MLLSIQYLTNMVVWAHWFTSPVNSFFVSFFVDLYLFHEVLNNMKRHMKPRYQKFATVYRIKCAWQFNYDCRQ